MAVAVKTEATDDFNALSSAMEVLEDVNARIKETAAKLAAQEMIGNLEEMRHACYDQIDDLNLNYEDHVKQMAIDRGYEIGTGQYKRRVVVDSSLFSTEYESQVVRKYEYFKTSMMEFSFDLNSLLRNDADTITLLAARAKNELDSWRKKTYDGKDSELAEHVGEAGKLKDPPDPLSSRGSNTDDPGKGQFGAIILDFMWNDARKNYGIQQLDVAVWDKKLWTGKGALGLEAPTVRSTATIAATVVATAVSSAVSFGTAGPVVAALGSAAISASITMSNELLFTALDVAGGYKSLYEAGKQLGASLVASSLGGGFGAAGAAVKGISGAAGVLIRTGLTAAEQTATKAATTFVASGGSWNAVKKSFDSFEDWGATASMMVSSYAAHGLTSGMSAETSKLYGGLVSLGAAGLGKAAEFGMYAAGSLLRGESLKKAYDNMGGITINVADIGSMVDMFATSEARNNATGQGSSSIAQVLRGTGILEVNFGSNGVTSRFGTGGINVGGNLYDFAKRMNDVRVINNYEKTAGSEKAKAAYNAYIYGDWTQENTAARLASGRDTLDFISESDALDENGRYRAKTVQKADGSGRNITMVNSGSDQMNAVLLGHESYRNGIIDTPAEQKAETFRAVTGHTEMALAMVYDSGLSKEAKGTLLTDEGLRRDIVEYMKGYDSGAFANYVSENYESGADYWLFKLDGTVIDDGNYYFSREIVDEAGNFKSEKIEGSDFTGSKIKALVDAIGLENVQKMLGKDITELRQIPPEVIKSVTNGKITDITHMTKAAQDKIFNMYGKEKFIGEYLLFENDYYYDDNRWNGTTLTLPGLKENESLGVKRNEDGTYTFFTAGLEFTREDNAFSVYDDWSIDRDNYTKEDYEKVANTTTSFYMRNILTGEMIAEETFDNAFTSVDNMNEINASLKSEYFKMYLTETTNQKLSDYRKEHFGTRIVGVMNGAETLEDLTLSMTGKDRPGAKSTLYHPMPQFGSSENCFGPMSDYNVGDFTNAYKTGTGNYYFQQQLDLYYSLGIYNGFQFNMHLQGKLKP